MQKFGLQRNTSLNPSSVELEIAKEQASALGRAGRKLRLSLERYQDGIDEGIEIGLREELLSDIAKDVWALLLQREFIGFVEGNLRWVKDNYVIPEEAIAMLGVRA
jgi:hypothetical protein